MVDEVRNVFIPHIHEDDAGLTALKELLAKEGYALRDASITSETPNAAKSPDYIKSQVLAPGIRWAGTVIVYLTPDTCKSDWVDWEVEYANSLDKRIVGVYANGSADCDLPDALRKYADTIVGWDTQRIIDAIDGKIDSWTKQTGEPVPDRSIPRYSCG
jgi:hypothetical protein